MKTENMTKSWVQQEDGGICYFKNYYKQKNLAIKAELECWTQGGRFEPWCTQSTWYWNGLQSLCLPLSFWDPGREHWTLSAGGTWGGGNKKQNSGMQRPLAVFMLHEHKQVFPVTLVNYFPCQLVLASGGNKMTHKTYMANISINHTFFFILLPWPKLPLHAMTALSNNTTLSKRTAEIDEIINNPPPPFC